MITYPSVTHKIPELFKDIIAIGRCKEIIFISKIVKLEHYKEVKKREVELLQAADKYIVNQRKN